MNLPATTFARCSFGPVDAGVFPGRRVRRPRGGPGSIQLGRPCFGRPVVPLGPSRAAARGCLGLGVDCLSTTPAVTAATVAGTRSSRRAVELCHDPPAGRVTTHPAVGTRIDPLRDHAQEAATPTVVLATIDARGERAVRRAAGIATGGNVRSRSTIDAEVAGIRGSTLASGGDAAGRKWRDCRKLTNVKNRQKRRLCTRTRRRGENAPSPKHQTRHLPSGP